MDPVCAVAALHDQAEPHRRQEAKQRKHNLSTAKQFVACACARVMGLCLYASRLAEWCATHVAALRWAAPGLLGVAALNERSAHPVDGVQLRLPNGQVVALAVRLEVVHG